MSAHRKPSFVFLTYTIKNCLQSRKSWFTHIEMEVLLLQGSVEHFPLSVCWFSHLTSNKILFPLSNVVMNSKLFSIKQLNYVQLKRWKLGRHSSYSQMTYIFIKGLWKNNKKCESTRVPWDGWILPTVHSSEKLLKHTLVQYKYQVNITFFFF